jgi:hypothetical protein
VLRRSNLLEQLDEVAVAALENRLAAAVASDLLERLH